MIEIKFTIDPERNAYEQLQQYIQPFAPVIVTATAAATTVEMATEEVVPAKRTRKTKTTPVATKAEVTETVIPEANDHDAEDEAAESASTVLTHDNVRSTVGVYAKKYGLVRAQKDIPVILGCAIADLPDDQVELQKAIWKIQEAMLMKRSEEAYIAQIEKDMETTLFHDFTDTPYEVTEQDVREAMMLYAKKYDGADTKMPNTLIDGADILKKTFGPTVTALRLIPKDPASLKKAYDAIVDATENNWYNRKVQG